MNTDREHFERLLSERADGLLTPGELAELNGALAGDAVLAASARRYERLGEFLGRWRALPSDIDWKSLSGRISLSVGEEVSQMTSGSVDDLVASAFGPMPEVDWAQLKTRISAAVREEAAAGTRMAQRSWSRTAKRLAAIGAPLAAAAVIALAIWMPRSTAPTVISIPTPVASLVEVSFETPEPAGQIKIAFEEMPYKGPDAEAETNGAAIANGPSQAVIRERVEEVALY